MIHTLISLTQDLSHWPHSNAPWVVICLERTPLWPNDFFTYFAFETSFTCMNILMLSKGMCIFERFTTCVARDWLLLRMNSNVILQLEFFHKSFATVLTGKWSFPRMILFFASQESLLVWMICCIVCMKITFFLCEPHCVFSEFGLFWNIFHRRGRQILTSVSYELSYDASIVLLPEKFCFSADKKNAFLQNDAFHASQECLLAWMICCNICM